MYFKQFQCLSHFNRKVFDFHKTVGAAVRLNYEHISNDSEIRLGSADGRPNSNSIQSRIFSGVTLSSTTRTIVIWFCPAISRTTNQNSESHVLWGGGGDSFQFPTGKSHGRGTSFRHSDAAHSPVRPTTLASTPLEVVYCAHVAHISRFVRSAIGSRRRTIKAIYSCDRRNGTSAHAHERAPTMQTCCDRALFRQRWQSDPGGGR